MAKKEGGIDKETLKTFVILLAPFAPHIGRGAVAADWAAPTASSTTTWPECDEEAHMTG